MTPTRESSVEVSFRHYVSLASMPHILVAVRFMNFPCPGRRTRLCAHQEGSPASEHTNSFCTKCVVEV